MRVLYKLSFRLRIWIAFMIIAASAIAITGLLSYKIAARVVEDNAYRLGQDTLNKTSQVLDERLNKVQQSVYSLIVSSAYRRAVGLDVYADSEKDNYYTYLTSLQATFVQTKLYEPLMHSILIATRDGDYYLTNLGRLFQNSFYNSDMYRRYKNSNAIWIEDHQDHFFSGGERVLSFVMEGVFGSNPKDVFVVANIKVTGLNNFIIENVSGSQERFLLVNSEGTPVISSDSNLFATLRNDKKFTKALEQRSGNYEFELDGKKYLVNFTRLKEVKDWTLFSILPKSELFKQMNDINWAILWIMIGGLIVSLVCAEILTRLLLKPLYYLQGLMKKVEMNDFNVRFESEYRDEITQLGYRFNRMLGEISRLFHEVALAEQEKRKAEAKALQAQIDPHFLYNTLNTIYWKCQLKHLQSVQEMVLALSSLFQLGLNKGQEMTTLHNELKHVEQYITIQQQCYENLFEYIIDVQEGLDVRQRILKIVLQPLVENSILHGFKDMNEGGRIMLKIRQDDQFLYLTVEDNGCGMQVNTLQYLSDERPLTGYALYNVQKRVKLHYGDEATINIASDPGKYTKVHLTIPRLE
ncbi:sensor histidine kinase [Bacillus sp. 3255]|uniref:sensor histidine kinase n=1 Tax=Bacillus sp. 3255 TaxID=2817904 RepID=UPI00285FAAD7|nr:sensor histidine kinase [Bacillus sp. 3255]MDR6882422.1 two-component system sensor histidine kinase YesM [Bacillus sp. 3255]